MAQLRGTPYEALGEEKKKIFDVQAEVARAQFDALTKAEKEEKACRCALALLPRASSKARSEIK
jgi:hypothetical protein